MTLVKIRDYLKTVLPHDNAVFSTAKLDATQQKTIHLFSRSTASSNIAIGGVEATGYGMKYLSLYVRWGKNAIEAEKKAYAIFEPLQLLTFQIDGLNCGIMATRTEPVALGIDDKGVYEYSMDFDFRYERRKS